MKGTMMDKIFEVLNYPETEDDNGTYEGTDEEVDGLIEGDVEVDVEFEE